MKPLAEWQLKEVLDSLVQLGVLEKQGNGEESVYSISFDFDLTFRGLLGHLLKRMKDPSLVEATINMAFADALVNYDFWKKHTPQEMELAVDIIRTFEKEDKVKQIMAAVGI